MCSSNFFSSWSGKSQCRSIEKYTSHFSITDNLRLFKKYALWNGSVLLLVAESYNSISKIRGRTTPNATSFCVFILLHWSNLNPLSVQSSAPKRLLLLVQMGPICKMKENSIHPHPLLSLLDFEILNFTKFSSLPILCPMRLHREDICLTYILSVLCRLKYVVDIDLSIYKDVMWLW